MTRALSLGQVTAILLLLGVGSAQAQVAPQTVEIAKVDVQKLQAGYRASKVIGSTVYNDANDNIGKIDDLLISPDGKEPFAVLSVGGFLGMGNHYVAIPYDGLKVVDKKLVLSGASKDSLRALPDFEYASE
jgi:sporulation protein YlmC with PRC-barrel domain